MTALVTPDLDQALIDWAPGILAGHGFVGWSAAAELAGDRTVAIFTTGGIGIVGGILDSPTVVVETAAATITLAARVLQVLRGLLRDLVGGWVPGSQVWLQAYAEFAGPAWLPVEDHPNRHSMTLSLTVATQPL